MDHRKIMVLGKSSFVVSLPKEWMRMNNLDRGDTVAMDIQKDKTLLIHPTGDFHTEGKEIHLVVEAEETNESITRRIISSYLDGYTRIKLTSGNIFTTEQHKAIRQIVGTLYMMILESEANSVTLQTLVGRLAARLPSRLLRPRHPLLRARHPQPRPASPPLDPSSLRIPYADRDAPRSSSPD